MGERFKINACLGHEPHEFSKQTLIMYVVSYLSDVIASGENGSELVSRQTIYATVITDATHKITRNKRCLHFKIHRNPFIKCLSFCSRYLLWSCP